MRRGLVEVERRLVEVGRRLVEVERRLVEVDVLPRGRTFTCIHFPKLNHYWRTSLNFTFKLWNCTDRSAEEMLSS